MIYSSTSEDIFLAILTTLLFPLGPSPRSDAELIVRAMAIAKVT